MARFTETEKRDPFRNFNFRIKLGDVEVAACRKMSGLTSSIEVVKFRAGNAKASNDEMLPGRVMYEAVTLEAGITNDRSFEDWANTLVHHEAAGYSRKTEPGFRRQVQILVYDIDNNHSRPVKQYTLHKAWVSKYTALSELAADANEVLIKTIEIQHEGFTREELS